MVYFPKLRAGHCTAASMEDAAGSLILVCAATNADWQQSNNTKEKQALLDFFPPLLLQGFGIYPVPTEGTGAPDDSATSPSSGESWAVSKGAALRERKNKSPVKYTYLRSIFVICCWDFCTDKHFCFYSSSSTNIYLSRRYQASSATQVQHLVENVML